MPVCNIFLGNHLWEPIIYEVSHVSSKDYLILKMSKLLFSKTNKYRHFSLWNIFNTFQKFMENYDIFQNNFMIFNLLNLITNEILFSESDDILLGIDQHLNEENIIFHISSKNSIWYCYLLRLSNIYFWTRVAYDY